jgi:hypothetical protein
MKVPQVFRRTIGKYNLLIVVFLCLLIGSFASIGFALYFQSQIGTDNDSSSGLKSQTGTAEFNVETGKPLSNSYAQVTTPVQISLTVNSTNLAQGEPSLVTVKISVENIYLHVDTMGIYLRDAIGILNASYSEKAGIIYLPSQPQLECILYPKPTVSEIQGWDVWEANGGAIFTDSGQVNLEIHLYVAPNNPSFVNMTDFKSEYILTLPIHGLTINSQESIQQTINQQIQENEQANNNYMNYSITAIVAFFTLLDLAFVCYDHSIDENKVNERRAKAEEIKRIAEERQKSENYHQKLEQCNEALDY